MPDRVVTREDLLDGEFSNKLTKVMRAGDTITFNLDDGTTKTVPWQHAALIAYIIRPYMLTNLPLRQEDIPDVSVIDDSLLPRIQTRIYERLLDECPDIPYMQLVEMLFRSVTDADIFARRKCQATLQTIDILDIIDVLDSPAIKEMANIEFTIKQGSRSAEKVIDEMTSKLAILLRDGTDLPNNPFKHFMTSRLLKENMLTQLLLWFGPRSDITGVVPSHIVSNSAAAGMVGPADFAVEALAAKKSMFFNSTIIKDSRSAARKLRIATSVVRHIHPGDCGNRIGSPVTIPAQGYKSFLDCAIWEGPNKVWLTEDVIDQYVGKKVMTVTPYTCRHQDGFCECCAGWGWDRTSKYFVPGVRIGEEAATKLDNDMSQTILSIKHLSRTMSHKYELDDTAANWFVTQPGIIYLAKKMGKGSAELTFKINKDYFGPLSDLELGVSEDAANFSAIPELILVDEHGEEYECILGDTTIVPFLSKAFLQFMEKNRKKITEEEDYIYVSLKGWNMSLPVFEYAIITADMIAFTSMVNTFFNTKLSTYTSASKATNDLVATLYPKVSVNFFYIQAIVRAFMVNPKDRTDPLLPIVTDVENVRFEKIRPLVARRSTTLKLAFEDVRRDFRDPTSYLWERGPSMYDLFFGKTKSLTV